LTDARFLALGDSYTIGEAVPESERWPVLVAMELRKQGITIQDPRIIAKTGWTTEELDDAIDAARPEGTFELVTLLIGVNDQYRARDAEAYRAAFSKLLNRAVAFAGHAAKRVIVVSIPDWGVTPFATGRDRAAISATIDRFNAANRDETAKAGALYVDVTPISREAAGDRALLASDGLHPSGVMYEKWTRLILPVAARVVQSISR
jgi:lysophospholipase L1-like esterase